MPEDERWRGAQESADELVRMGIEPRVLGLAPSTPPSATRSTPQERIPSAPRQDAPRWVGDRAGDISPTHPPRWSVESAAWGALTQAAETTPRWRLTGLRDRIRTAALHLVQVGAAAAIEREHALVARVRARHAEPRVVAFLAGKGGVGTTTTAAGVALVLATLRTDPVALVCARSGAGSLGYRLTGEPFPTIAAVTRSEGAQPRWAHERLAVVDGSPWHSPTRAEQLLRLLTELRSRHPLTLLDVGNDLAEAAQVGLGRADQVVLVTTASHDAVEATRVALSRIHQVDPFRLGSVVVVLTSLHPRQFRHAARRLRVELGSTGPALVLVPYDPALATGQPLDLARARPATREAYLRIAGLVAEPEQTQAWCSRPASGAAAQ